MNIITKLPGPLLVFLGACSLSFGGLIVKSFEGATLWQILFWRSLFFSLTVLAFLIISYRQKTFKAFKDSGLPGFIGGIILSFGFCGYVFSMYIWILFFKRKNFSSYLNINYSCYDWSITHGW